MCKDTTDVNVPPKQMSFTYILQLSEWPYTQVSEMNLCFMLNVKFGLWPTAFRKH